MKKVIWIVISGLVILIPVLLVKKCGSNEIISVSVEKPAKRSITEFVSANGKIQPEVELKITSDVSGEIIEMFVKEGDAVTKGQLLCRIRPDIYESAMDRVNAAVNSSKSNLQNTKAQLDQAKANLANATSSYNRNKKLFDQGTISQAEYDVAKAQYESAVATVKSAEETVKSAEFNINSAQASYKEANENLVKTMIYAPVSGTVSKLNVEKGERVQGVQGFQGTEIMRLANLNEMEVNVEVNENDIIRVKKNDTTLIEVDAYKDRKFKGIVTEIANSANTTGITADQVTNFAVKIRVLQESYKDLIKENSPAPFRPGMSATVEIQTKKVNNVLSVPIMAVTTRVDSSQIKKEEDLTSEVGGVVITNNLEEKEKTKKEVKADQVVFVVRDGKAKKIKVKTGIQDNDYIEITEGLNANDEVVSSPYGAISKKLKDDTAVQIKDKDKLFAEKE
ncbi:MAG: efflux RND transporter periplasmic adaptor subunit [Bacteroidota bacterium]|nr:efflux RND transporter periplasmic adaptor subunit [Bacteroidota bacterium]